MCRIRYRALLIRYFRFVLDRTGYCRHTRTYCTPSPELILILYSYWYRYCTYFRAGGGRASERRLTTDELIVDRDDRVTRVE